MFLPNRITICRKKLKMSQEKFLVFLAISGFQISRPTLASWENGITFPTAKELAELSMITNKSVSYFFDQKHNKTGYVSKCLTSSAEGKNRPYKPIKSGH
jgi:transcriptional regulator with XRE-family HTH domain